MKERPDVFGEFPSVAGRQVFVTVLWDDRRMGMMPFGETLTQVESVARLLGGHPAIETEISPEKEYVVVFAYGPGWATDECTGTSAARKSIVRSRKCVCTGFGSQQ